MLGEVDEDEGLVEEVSFCGKREREQVQIRVEGQRGVQNDKRSLDRNSVSDRVVVKDDG